jgi:hypothetical protein
MAVEGSLAFHDRSSGLLGVNEHLGVLSHGEQRFAELSVGRRHWKSIISTVSKMVEDKIENGGEVVVSRGRSRRAGSRSVARMRPELGDP